MKELVEVVDPSSYSVAGNNPQGNSQDFSKSSSVDHLICEPAIIPGWDESESESLIRCYGEGEQWFLFPERAVDGKETYCQELSFYGARSIQCSNEKGTMVYVMRPKADAMAQVMGTMLLIQLGAYWIKHRMGSLLNKFSHRSVKTKVYLDKEHAEKAVSELRDALKKITFNHLQRDTWKHKSSILPPLVQRYYRDDCRWAALVHRDVAEDLSVMNLQRCSKNKLANYQFTVNFLTKEFREFERADATLAKLNSYDDLFKDHTGRLLKAFLQLDKNKKQLNESIADFGYRVVEFENISETLTTLTDKAFALQKVEGAGHCFYCAMGLCLDKTQEELRSAVAEYIGNHRGDYIEAIEELSAKSKHSFGEFVAAIRSGEVWTDNLEISVLMKVLNRPIVVIGPQGIICNRSDLSACEGEPIFVHHNGYDHYDGLRLTEEYQQRAKALLEILIKLCQSVVGDEDYFYKSVVHQLLLLQYKGNLSAFSMEQLNAMLTKIREDTAKKISGHLTYFSDFYHDFFSTDTKLVHPSKIKKWRHYVRTIALARTLEINMVIIPSDQTQPIVIKQPGVPLLHTVVLGYDIENKYYSLVVDQARPSNPAKSLRLLFVAAPEDNYREDLVNHLLKEQAWSYGYRCHFVCYGEESLLRAIIHQLFKMGKAQLKFDVVKKLVEDHLTRYSNEYVGEENKVLLACARILHVSIVVLRDNQESIVIRREKLRPIIALGYDGAMFCSLLREEGLKPPEKNIKDIYLAAPEDKFAISATPVPSAPTVSSR